MLCRFCLQLTRSRDERHQREVDEQGIFAPDFLPHLPDGFQKRKRFDIADRAADLDDRNVSCFRNPMHRGLDFIGHVRNNLYGLTEIIAAPLLLDDRFVNPSGCEVVFASQFGMRVALVMAQIKVGFRAVVCDVNLAMLVRTHRSRIDVQIRIKFQQIDAESPAFQQASD